jgi:quercetin dioxygenase-like cupin family protein
MADPIVVPGNKKRSVEQPPVSASGQSFCIFEWSGSGPDYMHVHHADDEAWYVLEGTLTFKFKKGEVKAPPGTTVFVPAGAPHTYYEADGPTRYLIILTPRLRDLISGLHTVPYNQHDTVLRQYESEMWKPA